MAWILWIPSMSEKLAYDYKTTVAASNMDDAKVVHQKAVQRVESMKLAGDVVPYTAAENYTKQWHMTTVSAKVWQILDISV